MRGPNTDSTYLEPEILKILREAGMPMPALGINFRINDWLDKIIELNTVKRHLNILVKSKKILEKVKDDTTYYKINTRNRSI